MRHLANVDENGKLAFDNLQLFKNDCKQHTGKHVWVEVKRFFRKRSLKQNAYYHGIVVPMITNALLDIGNKVTEKQVDAYLCKWFLTETVELHDSEGEIISDSDIVRSTADLDTHEFNKFLEECMQFAAEKLDLIIPDPDPEKAKRKY